MSKDHFPVNDKTLADINADNARAYSMDSTPAERTARKLENPRKYPHQLLEEGGKGNRSAEVGSLTKTLTKRIKKSGISEGQARASVAKGNEKSGGPAMGGHTAGVSKTKTGFRVSMKPDY